MRSIEEGTRDERRDERHGGRRLFALSTLAVALMCAALLAAYGAGEPGLRSVVRNTARTSALLFVLAFVARPALRLWPTRASRRLDARAPYVFASFAASHLMHAAALLALALATRGDSLEGRATTLIVGGLAYVFTFAIALASFGARAEWVERRAYARTLRAVGLYLIWSIFTLSFTGRAVQSAAYVPAAALMFAALALRVAARLVRRGQARAAEMRAESATA